MDLNEWVGKRTHRSDLISVEKLKQFEAMLDRDPSGITNGEILPACSHWCYFTPSDKRSELGDDGQEKRGDFIPPIEKENRMSAGGFIQFKNPMKAGDSANRTSTIAKIEEKDGESGNMTVITISHAISKGGVTLITEDQEIAFRDKTDKGAYPTRNKPLDIDPDWTKSIKPDTITLFRFSALTFNSYRVHYDRKYVQNVEGYPDLVVQGRLLVLYMLDMYLKNFRNRIIRSLKYSIAGPIYLGEEINIHCGKGVDSKKSELRVTGPDKKIAVQADVEWGYSWD